MIVMMLKILSEVKEEDPMSGRWYVPKLRTGMVWCNVSNIVTCNYWDSVVAEDVAWLRKNDYNHINVVELEVVLKGINLTQESGLIEVEIRTDSATVISLVNSTIKNEERRISTKCATEIIVEQIRNTGRTGDWFGAEVESSVCDFRKK